MGDGHGFVLTVVEVKVMKMRRNEDAAAVGRFV